MICSKALARVAHPILFSLPIPFRSSKFARLAIVLLSTPVLFGPRLAIADYIGTLPYEFSSPGFTVRVRDTGAMVQGYPAGAPQSFWNSIETIQESAVTPDLGTVYTFVNTLGFSNVVAGSNVNTGLYQPSKTFNTPTPPFITSGNYINQAAQPLIHGNDLYVLSATYPGTVGVDAWDIKHYDLSTNTYVESFTGGQRLDDIAWRQNGFNPFLQNLYVATASGISRTTAIISSPFGNAGGISTPIVAGVRGNIAIGPDDRLYVRNFANGDVERYNPDSGAFIDTFISHTSFPNLGTIQFGVDGNLHIYQSLAGGSSFSNILKFNGATGALLSTTHTFRFLPPNGGRVTYIPVPEPAACTLIAIGVTCTMSRRRRSRR